jgi:Cu(I)/Ag(I) efflux system membrane protein CusA/SilA
MMTVAAIMTGFLPIMRSHGTGAEVMQRIAVPMIGGMISSTLLTLVVIPAIFGIVEACRLPRGNLQRNQRVATLGRALATEAKS